MHKPPISLPASTMSTSTPQPILAAKSGVRSPSRIPARPSSPAPLSVPDRRPDSLGRRWHVDVVDPVLPPQAIDDGIDYRWAGADGTCFTRSLDPERIGGAGDVVGLEGD